MEAGEGTQKDKCDFSVLGALAVDGAQGGLAVWYLVRSPQLGYFQEADMLPPTWNHNQVKEGNQEGKEAPPGASPKRCPLGDVGALAPKLPSSLSERGDHEM